MGQPQPGQDPPRFEARLYDRLFTTQTPGSKKKKAGEGEDAGAAAGQRESWSSVMCKQTNDIMHSLAQQDHV